MQSLGFYERLQGPVSDYALINRVSKERALYQVIKYSSGAIKWTLEHNERECHVLIGQLARLKTL